MIKILIILCFASITVFGQNLHQRFDGIPFSINNVTPLSPFNGGIEIPRFEFTDIDNDGDLDLFIFDKDTTLNFYKNEGSASSHVFKLNTTRYHNLNIRNWFRFVDADNDNDKDLFCGGDSQHVRYYRNIGSGSNPSFSLISYAVKTDLNIPVNSESQCVPVFADMDGDGDFDFFSGASTGKVTYYENIGTASNFQFKFITDFYKGIEIIGGAFRNPKSHSDENERHGASSITFADTDGDGDKDLYWGDLFGLSIYYLKNTGTAQNFTWNFVDTTSPEPNPYYSNGFNMPGIYDIDADGRNDFFIGVLIGAKSLDNFVYYKNNGPLNNPVFTKITDNFIPSVDAGAFSYPAMSDIDNDGDRDLFLGNDHSVAFYRNTGTASAPAFTLVNDSLPLNIPFNYNYSPALGDLDGDGKKDMVLGYFAGAKLRFYKNTGTLADPVFTYQASQMDTMNFGQSSMPCLADLDNDGDLDILGGSSAGRLRYYQNNGNASAFNYQFITSNYANIFVGNDAAPSLGDMDNDGDMDLMVGNRLGTIAYYVNNGSPNVANFSLVTSTLLNINVYQNSVPCIVDINNDNDKDMLLGNTKGGLYFYENWDVFGIQQIGSEIPREFGLGQNYPNPFNPLTNVKFQMPNAGFIQIKVFDITGKEIAVLVNEHLAAGTYEADWDASDYPSGVYFCRMTSGGFTQTMKMVLVK